MSALTAPDTVSSMEPPTQRDHSEPLTGSQRSGIRDHSDPRLSESSRSSNGEKTTDGATRLAPKGSLSAAPRQEIPALQQEIMDALGYGLSEAKDWAGNKLKGKNLRNPDAYLRKCLANHVAENHQKPATKKKTGSAFICPRCGRGFFSKSSLGSHAGHCATTECPDCNSTVKARDLDWHRKHVHGIDRGAERLAFLASIRGQPPCIHGYPGGNIGQPGNSEDADWMRCPLCRNDAQRSA
jgi:hypothetical protein